MPSFDGSSAGGGGGSTRRSEAGSFAVDEAAAGAVAIDDEAAEAVFDALSSATGRAVLARLHERPRTPSELADVVETSLQNVGHHVDQLVEAGLVEATGVEHSDRGRERNLYAPTTDALVLHAGVGRSGSPAASDGPGRGAPGLWFGLGALAGAAATVVWRSVASGRKG